MKATIEQPQERMVTLVMTEKHANALMRASTAMTPRILMGLGASEAVALIDIGAFIDIHDALGEVL